MILLIGRRIPLTAQITGLDANGLTGYSAKLLITSAPGIAPVLNKAGVISSPLTCAIDITVLPADLTTVDPGVYKFEVNIWKTSDPTIVYTPISGSLEIKPGLTSTPTA